MARSSFLNAFGIAFSICVLSPFVSSARADLIFNANFVDAAGQTWDATTRGVVNQAINDWKQVFSGVNGATETINFNVTFAHATTSGYLGVWQGGFSAFSGDDIRPWSPNVNHTISFNVDHMAVGLTNRLWFDPTPTTGGDQSFNDWDALTVTRHEIGHMLGFTTLYVDNFNTPGQTNPWTSRIVNNIFDPGGLNVAMNADKAHLGTASGDLMSPSLFNGSRIGISSQEANMLSLAYGYSFTAVPEPTSMVLLGSACTGFFLFRRRKILAS